MNKTDCLISPKFGRLLALVALISIFSLVPSSSFSADSTDTETFVSFNGQFKIEIPDGWMRIDYRTVDYYLGQTSQENELLDYEAVFSPDKKGLFYNREYLMLTVDTVGELSRRQIDSVLADMADAFEVKLERRTISNFATDLEAGTFLYDDQQQVGAVATEVYDAGKVYKISLLVVKFYEKGLANFYFFAPIENYSEVAKQFYQISSSFSTKELKEVSPKPVPVVELEEDKPWYSKPTNWVPFVGLFIVIIILARRKRLKAKQKN